MLRLGSPGKDKLDMLPGNAIGIPLVFEYDLLPFLDFKEHACIWNRRLNVLLNAPQKLRNILHGFWLHALILFGLLSSKQTDGPCHSIVGWVFFISPDHQ
jgi:hypothetical protein